MKLFILRSNLYATLLALLMSCCISCNQAKSENKMVKAKDIIKTINKGKSVLYMDCIIKDDLDLTQLSETEVDGNGTTIAHIGQTVSFVQCVFLGKVTTNSKGEKGNHQMTFFDKDVFFRNCDFRGTVDLSNSRIGGNLVMAQSKFREEADFSNLTVRGTAQLWELLAEKDFSFAGVNIDGNLNMMDAHFEKGVNFQGIECSDLQAGNLQCEDALDLSMITVNGNVLMNYAKVQKGATLADARIKGRCNIIGSTFEGNFSMEDATFMGKTKFNKSVFNGNVSTNGALFYHAPEAAEVQTQAPMQVEVLQTNKIEIK